MSEKYAVEKSEDMSGYYVINTDTKERLSFHPERYHAYQLAKMLNEETAPLIAQIASQEAQLARLRAELVELRDLEARINFIYTAFDVALETLQKEGHTEENRQNYRAAITLQSQFFATYKPRRQALQTGETEGGE